MFNVSNETSPMIFSKLLHPKAISNLNLRQLPEVTINSVYSGAESISFLGSKKTKEIKGNKSLEAFKLAIKNWQPENCLCRLCKTYI